MNDHIFLLHLRLFYSYFLRKKNYIHITIARGQKTNTFTEGMGAVACKLQHADREAQY